MKVLRKNLLLSSLVVLTMNSISFSQYAEGGNFFSFKKNSSNQVQQTLNTDYDPQKVKWTIDQENRCEEIKTGRFTVENSDGSISKIRRNKRRQIEKCGSTVVKDKIEWINDCSYRLISKKIKDKTGLIKADALVFTILTVRENSYDVLISGGESPDIVVEVGRK